MSGEDRIVRFTVDQPYEVAIRMLRRALANEGLRVPCEVDTSARLKRELGVVLRKNIVLYVDDPIRLLEATVMNPAGGLFIPEPVVLSGDDYRSQVAVRALEATLTRELPASIRGAVTSIHERVLDGIQQIGQKEPAFSREPHGTAMPA